MNTAKCESILFRRPLRYAGRDLKRNWKKFKINIYGRPIELKESVKYLGVNIDNMCYMAQHMNEQLLKARNAFMGARRLFYNKHISERVKIIGYKALIRPILTYGCQVWYNQVPRYMERYRVFERKCLRHCHGSYRKAETGYTHYISNQKQYDRYDSDRIDTHIIKLTRDHVRRACLNTENSLIYGSYHIDTTLMRHYMAGEIVPGPNTFTYLDQKGYIEDREGTPLVYHVQRRPNEKWFEADKFENPAQHLRFNTDIRRWEPGEIEERRAKYWWLNESHHAD